MVCVSVSAVLVLVVMMNVPFLNNIFFCLRSVQRERERHIVPIVLKFNKCLLSLSLNVKRRDGQFWHIYLLSVNGGWKGKIKIDYLLRNRSTWKKFGWLDISVELFLRPICIVDFWIIFFLGQKSVELHHRVICFHDHVSRETGCVLMWHIYRACG